MKKTQRPGEPDAGGGDAAEPIASAAVDDGRRAVITVGEGQIEEAGHLDERGELVERADARAGE